MSTSWTWVCVLAAVTSTMMGRAVGGESSQAEPAANRVFEMRTYTTFPGRLDALQARFRDHTCRIFQKHGMTVIGFWTPQAEADGKANTLVYLLAYPSREAATASWKAFRDDPEWIAARDASEKDGKIVDKITSVFLDPTTYSPIR